MEPIELFASAPPGLEPELLAEVQALGFAGAEAIPGGVRFDGGWPEAQRANLWLRGAGRVLARIAAFRALHPAQLDKRARKIDWASLIPEGCRVSVEATCRKSRIYHAGAAKERVANAALKVPGVTLAPEPDFAIQARIDDDLCTISLDTSGAPLHRRGQKQAVGKAPMRETLAALMLRRCGYDGTEPVVDPMCGSGTFLLEAASMAAGLAPGRDRDFAFEQLVSHIPADWEAMQQAAMPTALPKLPAFLGSDRDAGAIKAATANAERSGLGAAISFVQHAVSDATPPDGTPGLVIVNPPYGGRIGNRKLLFAVYGALGETLRSRFGGWRVGLVTSDDGLAKATKLPFLPKEPHIPHGGMKVRLFRTGIL